MSATLNGQQCSDAEVTIPRFGVPWGRCTLTDDVEIPAVGAQVLLEIASIPMLCTVVEAGERGGVTSIEFVGGYGGWSKPPPEASGYLNGAGVTLAEVAEKLAVAVGESVIVTGAASRPIGEHVAVAGSDAAPSAGALLSQLCALPAGSERLHWYVDPTGTTRIGDRLPLPEVDAVEVDRNPLGTWLAFSSENAALMLPGATVGGREIGELRIEATPDGVRETVTLIGEEPQGFAARFWSLVVQIVLPFLLWRTVYTYKVTKLRAGNRLDIVPTASGVAPQFESVRVWPGVGGAVVTPKVGAKCLVAFADGNPNAPMIVGWQPQLATLDTKWKPDRVDHRADLVVLADGTKPAGRGGMRMTLAPLPAPLGAPGPLVLTVTDPDDVAHVWTVTGANSGGPVLFTVSAGPGVNFVNGRATLDAGRAEVRV